MYEDTVLISGRDNKYVPQATGRVQPGRASSMSESMISPSSLLEQDKAKRLNLGLLSFHSWQNEGPKQGFGA